jgi:DNA adenine methylase Dam
MIKTLRSTLVWPGNKTKLYLTLDNYLPKESFNIFVDPFVGAGGFAYNFLKSRVLKEVHLNDLKEDIVNYHNILKNDHIWLYNNLIEFQSLYQTSSLQVRHEVFNSVRDDFNKETDKNERVILLCILQRLSYNGKFSENNNKEYNSTFNYDEGTVTFCDYQSICLQHGILNRSKTFITNLDYKDLLKTLDDTKAKDTFIFFDPPYDGSQLKYGKEKKSLQEELCAIMHDLDKRGYRLLMLNHYNENTLEMYKDNFNINSLKRNTFLGSSSAKKLKGDQGEIAYKEIIIRNYQ